MAERAPSKKPAASKQTIKKLKSGRPSANSVGRSNRVTATKITKATEKTSYRPITSRYNQSKCTNEKAPLRTTTDRAQNLTKSSLKKDCEKPKQTAGEDQSYNLVPVNIVTYGGKNYDLSKIPQTDSQLVKEQTKIVNEHLRLTMLGNDLSSLGKFVRLGLLWSSWSHRATNKDKRSIDKCW